MKKLFNKLRHFAGVVKSKTSRETPERERQLARQLRQARERLARRENELSKLQARLAENGNSTKPAGVKPENIIWMFGSGRTGSTWLASMMGDMEGQTVWHEPLVGTLFGNLYYLRAGERHRDSRHFILGQHKKVWVNSIRSFVLEGAGARFPKVADCGYLVVKEPNGSIGAPLIMEALPESRMIFLLRDPRDAVASAIDSQSEGGWVGERRGRKSNSKKAEQDPEAYAKARSKIYSQDIGNSKQAYEAHEGPKTLVRYEDLRSDTLSTMRRIYKELEIEVEEQELVQVVEKHSWGNIPEEEKGQGKFYRKAMPGGWREDLTEEQVRIVEKITAPLLEEFYPNDG